MKGLRVTLEAEIDVVFAEPEKAHKFFIESEWAECFSKYDSLHEVSQDLAFSFHNTSSELRKKTNESGYEAVKDFEAYPVFVRKGHSGIWVAEYEDIGKITVTYESELQPVYDPTELNDKQMAFCLPSEDTCTEKEGEC